MQETQQLAKQLELQIPFLRQKLSGLDCESQHYKKISLLIQLITNPSIRYSTLAKVEKVIDILRNKEKRGKISISSPPRQEKAEFTAGPADNRINNSFDAISTTDEKIASVRSHFEDVQDPENTIQSPDSNSIQSPDDFGGSDVSDRYENDTPSIYSVVADTIKLPLSEQSHVLNFIPPPPLVPVVPTIDTSKPPISAADLEELLLQVPTVPCVEKNEEVKKEDGVVTDADAMLSGCGGHKSKVSLVPTPFHVRKDKTEKKVKKAEKNAKDNTERCDKKVAEKSESKDKVKVCKDKEKDRDKNKSSEKVHKHDKSDTKVSTDTNMIKNSKETKTSKNSNTSGKDKDTKKVKSSKNNKDSRVSKESKDTKSRTNKDKIKSSDKKDKPRPVEKIVESESIFGSLFSTLDAKLISDQTRRDSKDGDQRCDSKNNGSSASITHSKDKHSSSSGKSELTRLANKIKTAEKDMEIALNKAITEADKEEVRKKYSDKIKRYKKDIEGVNKRQSRLSSDEKKEEKVKDSAKGNDKGKEKKKDKEKDARKKSKTKEKERNKNKGAEMDKNGCKPAQKSEGRKVDHILEKPASNEDQLPITEEIESKPSIEEPTNKLDQISIDNLANQSDPSSLEKTVSHLDQPSAEQSSSTPDPSFTEKLVYEVDTKVAPTEKAPVSDSTPKADFKTDIKSLAEKYPAAIKVVKKSKSAQPTPICIDLPLPSKKPDDLAPSPIINTTPVQPLLPPPLPLGFQDFNPFANESAEITRLQRRREEKLRSPLHEVGNDHIQHGHMSNIQNATRDWAMKDPRVWSRVNNVHTHQPQQAQGQLLLSNWIPPAPITRNSRGAVRDLQSQGRWEPPPAVRGDGHQKPDYMGMRFIPPPPQPPTHLPGFHPFEPIGNEYDLSKMPPIDFYHPASPLSDVPKNYREWKQLKKMEEMQALRFKEVEEVELARSAKIKQANEELAKQMEEEKNKVEEKVDDNKEELKRRDVEDCKKETRNDKNSNVLKIDAEPDQLKEVETNSQLHLSTKKEDNQKETVTISEEDVLKTPEKISPTVQTGRVLRPRRKSIRLNQIDDDEPNLFLNDVKQLSPQTTPARNMDPLLKTPVKSSKPKERVSPITPQSEKKVSGSPRRKSRRLNPDQPENDKLEETQKVGANTTKDDVSMQMEPVLLLEEPLKEAKIERPPQISGAYEESIEVSGIECELKPVNPSCEILQSAEPAAEENFENLLQQINETEVNRDSLLKILGQAKNKVSPTKFLEMLELYLKNQDSSRKRPSSEVVDAQPEKGLSNVPKEEKQNCEENGRCKEITEDLMEVKDILIQDVSKKEEENIDKPVVSELNVDEEEEKKVVLESPKKVVELEDKPVQVEFFKNIEIPCGRRLRRRTTINYNEFKISDSEESPKRKKKPAEVSEEPKKMKKHLEVESSQLENIEESQLATQHDEKNKEETPIEEIKIETPNTQSVVISESIYEPNIFKIIDAVAEGLGSLEEKRQQIIQRQEEAELTSLLEIITGENEEEMSAFLAEISVTPVHCDSRLQPTPSPLSNLSDTTSVIDEEKDKRIAPKTRKSELDILHMDIKACLGEGIMTSRRGTASVSSRASSPGSVKSCTSSKDFNLISNRELAEMKDVKLPPAADELFKSRKTLKVVLQKLPDSRDICGESPVTVQSNKGKPKGNKASENAKRDKSVEGPLPTAKRPQSTIDTEIVQIAKKLKLEKGQPDKNYYLLAEKNDVNVCHICDFVGPSIITHYIMEHPQSEVLISRLAPDSTQEAFQESVINDYNTFEANNIGGKKMTKFDFRCRFCSHDLQKEPISAFYDHVSTHTGEARFHCPDCPFKHHVKVTVKKHITFAHGKILEPLMDEPPKNYEKLFGYICSECNYLQLRKEAIKAHIGKYHSAEPAYVYAINMSLPILQRTMKMQKDECADQMESPLIHTARKLRSSQRLKKPEVPTEKDKEPPKRQEVSKKLDTSELNSSPESVPSTSKGNLTKDIANFELPEDLVSSTQGYKQFKESAETSSAPSTAFVCDNWDELLNKPAQSAPTTDIKLSPAKRNSSFLDALKKRLDEQCLVPPVDTAIDSLRPTTPSDKQVQIKMEVTSPQKISANNEDVKPPSVRSTSDCRFHSVGVVEASIDDAGVVTYVCRKSSCIFNTTDSRVHEVHCTYKHDNCMEKLECPLCPERNVEMPMIEVFAHLCEHVDTYLKTSDPCNNIKVEQDPEEIEIIEPEVPIYDVDMDMDDDDMMDQLDQDQERIIPSQFTPPKMTLIISKVESLAVQQAPSCSSSSTSIFSEAGEFTTSTPEKNNGSRIGGMGPVYSKSPAIVTKWLKTTPEVLLKCPEYNCEFTTMYENAFDKHLDTHEFEGGMVNCLYCPTNLRKNCYKSHVIILHISSKYGCGHCLYRAVLGEYVEEHHLMVHPDKIMIILHFSNVCAKYVPPSRHAVPAVKSVVKPYICGCGKEYYVVQNYRHHRSVCQTLVGADQVKDLSLFNCRYCMKGGSTPREILRHQAIMHPHRLLYIITRKTKSKTPVDEEPPNITFQLLIMNLSMYKRFQKSQEKKNVNASSSQVVAISPQPTLGPVVATTVGDNLPRLVLVHPVVLGANTKSAVLVVPTASLTTSTSSITAPTTTGAPSTPSIPKISTASSLQPVPMSVPTTLPTCPPQLSISKMPPTLSPFPNKQLEDLFRCNTCLLVCGSSQQLLEHVNKCQPDRHFACYHCKKVYRQAPVLIQHIRTHGNKNLICGLCGHKEATLIILKKHVRDEHKMNNIALQPLVPDKSNIDFDFFIGKPTMTKAIVSSDKSAKPKGKVIETVEDLTVFGPGDIELLPTRPIFSFVATCKICNFATKVRSNFLRHLLLHSSGQFDSKLHAGQAVNPVPCLEKNELMFDKMTNLAASSFEGRMSSKMGGASAATTVASIDTPTAQVVEKVTNIPMYIPEERRYICGATGCNYLSLEEPNLRHHLQALHDNEQYFRCIHCKIEVTTNKEGKEGKSAFIDIDHIMNHFRLHEMELFQCSYCDHLNTKSISIEKHCMEKHPDKQPSFIILRGDSKDKQAAFGENVKPVKKRPWRCALCLCRKSTEEDIKAHAKEKHTLQGQYKCTYCHFTDNSKPVVEEHLNGDHPYLSPDIIVAYLRDDKEEVEESVENSFDTTPLWLKNRASVKHIRGILLDLEAASSKKAAKVAPVKAVGKGRRLSMKAVDVPPSKKQKMLPNDEEEIVIVVEEGRSTTATSTVESPLPKPPTLTNKPPSAKFKVYSKHPPVLPKKPKTPNVIEIPDDSDDTPNSKENPTDPSLSTLSKISLPKLLKTDIVSTYGPLGRPTGTNFICPLCNSMNISDEESFRDHIYEEMQCNQYQCMLCEHQTTASAKMILHFEEKHKKQYGDENVKKLSSNESIDTWFAKVLTVQKRIISFNRLNPKKVFYRCGHCKYKTMQYMVMMAHVGAAHPDKPAKVTELTLFKTTKPTGASQTSPKVV